jgi:hypothetical protein
MRRFVSLTLLGVLLSGLFVAFDSKPANANAISLTFPSGSHRFEANEWESVAGVTGTTPSISGGSAGADLRVTARAVDNGARK